MRFGGVDFGKDEGKNIICPICGSENVHMTEVFWVDGYDEGGSSNYRQGHIEITLECEQNWLHKWVYLFGEHKGNVFFDEKRIARISVETE